MEPADPKSSDRRLTDKDIIETVGQIDNTSIAAILDTGVSHEELLEAFAWYSQESDTMGEARHPLSGRVERVYCILIGDSEFPDAR
jgi:hypothetical protein